MEASAVQRIDKVLRHPRFYEARDLYMEGYLAFYSGDPLLNKLFAEAARHVIVTFVLCLSAASRADNASTWLTLGKLQDEVEKHGVGSPGLVETVVARMLDRGLLSSKPAAQDRRKRVLSLTPALLQLDRNIIIAQAAPTALVLPSPAMQRAIECDPEFHTAHRAFSVNAFGMAMEFFARNRDAMRFIQRDSGLMVLFSLLSSARKSAGGSTSSVSYQELNDRFGISRTHTRDLIDEAGAQGWLKVQEAGGTSIEIQPPLWNVADRYIADAMDFFAYCCEEACKDIKCSA